MKDARLRRVAAAVTSASVAVCRFCGRLRYELIPAAATFGLTTMSWWHHATGIGWTDHAGYGLATAATGALCWKGLEHKNTTAALAGLGGTVMSVDTWLGAALGPSVPSFMATGATMVGAYWAYGPWLVKTRHDRMNLQIKAAKNGSPPNSMGLNIDTPGVTGDSTEETALRRALVALGIPAQDVSRITYTETGWNCVVTLPPGKNTSAAVVIAKQKQLAANLDLPGALRLRVGERENQLLVQMQVRDPLTETIAWPGPAMTSCTEWLPLGLSPDGTPFGFHPLYNHVLVAGATDNGKSGVLNVILGNLVACQDAEVLLVDMKPGAVELGPWESCALALADTASRAKTLFDMVRQEIKERGELMSQWRRETGVPVRKWDPAKHGRPAWFIVIDELAELIRRAPDLAKELESLKQLARFAAIMFVEATQSPSAKVFGDSTDARQQYQVRIGLGVTEPTATNLIFGVGAHGEGWRLDLLNLPGKLMIASRDKAHKTPLERRAYYPTDEDIAATIAEYGGVSRDGALLEPTAPAGGPRGGGSGGGTPVPPAPGPTEPAARPRLRPVPTFPDGSRIPDNRLALWEALRKAGPGGLTLQEAVAQGIAGHRTSVQGPISQWVAKGWVDDSGVRGRAKVYVLTATEHAPAPIVPSLEKENTVAR
ncbi:FtsK/SpoIIIE domain-containing protein [Streptomyces sp. Inha503]|uniref:FtsK/SpoIIIE domain-containing protein n=1 Tax=Streptomyces sp. Inha503 TaxID=3383314 RepID=UPI0039A2AF03